MNPAPTPSKPWAGKTCSECRWFQPFAGARTDGQCWRFGSVELADDVACPSWEAPAEKRGA